MPGRCREVTSVRRGPCVRPWTLGLGAGRALVFALGLKLWDGLGAGCVGVGGRLAGLWEGAGLPAAVASVSAMGFRGQGEALGMSGANWGWSRAFAAPREGMDPWQPHPGS